MTQKTTTRRHKTIRTQSEREALPMRYFILTFICGVLLIAGFFGAAHQHFLSMDYGIKNSKLRKEIDNLEAEQRRMLLSKEVVLSPAEIKKSAKKLGFTEISASNIEVYRNDSGAQQNPSLVRKTLELSPMSELPQNNSAEKSENPKKNDKAPKAEKVLKEKEKVSSETKDVRAAVKTSPKTELKPEKTAQPKPKTEKTVSNTVKK